VNLESLQSCGRSGYPAGDKELEYEDAEKSKTPVRHYGK
jgi:hypothetical protein